MPEDSLRQSIIDDEHLKLLSLGYMISAGTSAFFSLFGLFYVVMGIGMSFALSHSKTVPAKPNELPPAFVGWIFGTIGLGFFVLFLALAAIKLKTAFCIRRRTSKTFCMVVAGFTCLGFPYGTALGILTFIVLGRDSVIHLFDSGVAAHSSRPTS
jgi:hypothetical protein